MKRRNILSVLLAACSVASFAANVCATKGSSEMIATKGISIVFSPKNGAIVSLKGTDGIERVEPAEAKWEYASTNSRMQSRSISTH